MVVYAFIDEGKRAGGSLTKFWCPGMSVCIKSPRRLLWQCFLVFEGSTARTKGLVAFFFSFGLAGIVAVVPAVGQMLVLGFITARWFYIVLV